MFELVRALEGSITENDILAANAILLDVKAVSALRPTQNAHILTYLQMSQTFIRLLLNVRGIRRRDGPRRFIV